MTLQAQVLEALAKKGHVINTEPHKVRLTQALGMWPINGFVLVDGVPKFDYFCDEEGGGVWVAIAD